MNAAPQPASSTVANLSHSFIQTQNTAPTTTPHSVEIQINTWTSQGNSYTSLARQHEAEGRHALAEYCRQEAHKNHQLAEDARLANKFQRMEDIKNDVKEKS